MAKRTAVADVENSKAPRVRGRPLTPTQAAERLGVHRKTLYELIRNGRIVAVRITGAAKGSLRVFEGDLEAYLDQLPKA